MATYAQERTITYGSLSLGGSSARRIDRFMRWEEDYESGAIEFDVVTSASTDALFNTELNAIRDAFRQPRQDLTVVQNTGGGNVTIISRKHSDNTGLDTYPEIITDGHPADTGRSHRFRLRISYGLPANNLSQAFRRTASIDLAYSPSRQRTLVITGVYTANSSDGTTGSLAQYLAQIATYAAEVLALSQFSAATFEKVGEPSIESNETYKVTTFTQVYKEILFDQDVGTTNVPAIVDPQMLITVSQMGPGDSTAGGANIGSVGGVGQTQVGSSTGPSIIRPSIVTVTYDAAIDVTVSSNLTNLWTSIIRNRMISAATSMTSLGAKPGVLVLEEDPGIDRYNNRISARMVFMCVLSDILSQRVDVKDSRSPGKVLTGTYGADPEVYYEFPGMSVRTRTISEQREIRTKESNANILVDNLVAPLNAQVTNIADANNWIIINRTPSACSLRKGTPPADGGIQEYIATIEIETTLQYRKKLKPSKANAGKVTGSTVTLSP